MPRLAVPLLLGSSEGIEMSHHLVARKLLRCLVLLSLVALVLPTTSWGAKRHVRAGASGNGSGSDWTNAYTNLPATLIRGDTYYVAAGSYGNHNFNDTETGTTVITIKAVTIAEHGTDVGWSNGYVGQATFVAPAGQGVWNFQKGYYTLDGVYGCSPTSTCGFRADMSGHTEIGCGAAGVAIILEANVASNVRFQYVEVKGTGNISPDPNIITDHGVRTWNGNSRLYFGNMWIHDQGGLWMLIDGVDGATIENSWFRNNRSTPACHAEGIALRAPFGVGNTNLTIRYNKFENADGTGYIGTPVNAGLSGPTSSNWYIYGNVFFTNAA